MPNGYTAGKPTQFQWLLEQLKTQTDECQEWPFGKTSQGYGQIWHESQNKTAHRVAKKITDPAFNPALDVLHRCDNPPCFNPRHTFQGTQSDNGADMVRKGRSARGERQGSAKLTEDKVRQIRKMRSDGYKHHEIATIIGISRPAISAILTRGYWKHVQ